MGAEIKQSSRALAVLLGVGLLLVQGLAATCGPDPADGYAHSNVVDVHQNCTVGTANNPACIKYPGGCYLYETYSLPHASANPPFFLTGSSGQDHRLALPVKPCRGVEDIATDKDCGGEDIWDWAWGQINNAKTYGMAVNPTNKRGQHQLHVHLSPVQRDLQNALRDVANAKKTDFVPIDCKGSPSSCTKECGKAQAQQCTALLNQKPSGSGITAKWVDVAHPFLMKPFASAPDKKCQAVLVSQPTSSGFVLVHADDRAAECLLYCTSTGGGSVTECQGHCQTDHLGC